MDTYGRNRESIADIEAQLDKIFENHEAAIVNEAGVTVIPGEYLPDIFRSLSDAGMEVLTAEDEESMKSFVAQIPGIQVSSADLIGLLAQLTKSTLEPDLPRGRSLEVDEDEEHSGSGRSSSSDSIGTHRNSSRPPSRGVPQTPRGPSAFDSSRRQRATPLSNTAPTSYRRPPHHRRKSDAGSRSDSESFSASPNAYNRPPSRTRSRARAPSNPTSPSSSGMGLMSPDASFEPIGSPTYTPSRPHSRTRSHPQGALFGTDDRDRGYSSPEDSNHLGLSGSPSHFIDTISTLPMPRQNPDSDEDSEEEYEGLVYDRSVASSTASMEPSERLEALQRANQDLRKKLVEAEMTLQNKLSEHEIELEELQGKLEEMRSELSATKREEKELRSKERSNSTQISTLENEVNKLTKQLEHARTTYQSLQRQYQEQCSASEKYRVDLRQRDELIMTLRESASLHDLEQLKWGKEHESYEMRISQLEEELVLAQQTHQQLDEQKQENLLLKETIDRMRFEMDEMRGSFADLGAGGAGGGSGVSSRNGTVGKSLGAELMKVGQAWGDEGEEDDDKEGGVGEDDDEDGEGGSETVVEEEGSDDEGFETTIIRRTRKKVASRANKSLPLPPQLIQEFEEVKEYSDSGVQYDQEYFHSDYSIQTEPEPEPPVRVMAPAGMQTEVEEVPERQEVEVLTEPVVVKQLEEEIEVVPRVLIEMEIQTEMRDDEESDELETEENENQASTSTSSSSSTILPPTPKSSLLAVALSNPLDQPPAYSASSEAEAEAEAEWRLAAETLRKWHRGAKIAGARGAGVGGIPGGVDESVIEGWKRMKEVLGVECGVIDNVLDASERVVGEEAEVEKKDEGKGRGKRRESRLFRLISAYINGEKDDKEGDESETSESSSSSSLVGTYLTPTLIFSGATLIMGVVLSSHIQAVQYVVPGGPTYYDRAAWRAFNTMGGVAAGEGFAFDGARGGGFGGTDAVWEVVGRMTGGAVRIVRGWPT